MSTVVTQQEAEENIDQISSSFTIFLVVVVIVLFFMTGVFIANTFFYGELRKGGCGKKITASEANVMYWLNLAGTLVSGVLAIVAIFYIFIARSKPQWTQTYTGRIQEPVLGPGQPIESSTLDEQAEQLFATQREEKRIKRNIARGQQERQRKLYRLSQQETSDQEKVGILLDPNFL